MAKQTDFDVVEQALSRNECTECEGYGYIITPTRVRACSICKGSGLVVNNEALEALNQLEQEQEWIPVSERLPETECDSKAYYVYATHKVFMPKTHLAAYCDGGFSFLDWDAWTVTHWLPLPAPPKETE